MIVTALATRISSRTSKSPTNTAGRNTSLYPLAQSPHYAKASTRTYLWEMVTNFMGLISFAAAAILDAVSKMEAVLR